MEKKVTVRDVAREAGVSVATVSYVINDRKDVRISEATRKKVLQIANLLGYRPSYQAIGLTTGHHHLIGIVYRLPAETLARNYELTALANLLSERLGRMGYGCLCLSPEIAEQSSNHALDGLIALDLSEAEFKAVSNSCYVPILCLDMCVNDFLFYQICTDMEQLAARAAERLGPDYLLICDRFRNERFSDYIASVAPSNRLLWTSPELEPCALRGRKVLAVGALLGLALSRFLAPSDLLTVTHDPSALPLTSDLPYLHNDIERKANLAVNIMLNALEKKFDVKHDYLIC